MLVQVFTNRGLEQMAANADSLRQQVEEFKALVPLVQVRAAAAVCSALRSSAPTAVPCACQLLLMPGPL